MPHTRKSHRRKGGADSRFMNPPPAKVTEFLGNLQAFANSLPEPKVSGLTLPSFVSKAASSLTAKHIFENPGKEYNIAIQYLTNALQLLQSMKVAVGSGISTDAAMKLLAQLACEGKIEEPKSTFTALSTKLDAAKGYIKIGTQEKAFVCESDIKVDPNAPKFDRAYQAEEAAKRPASTQGLYGVVSSVTGARRSRRTRRRSALTRRRKH
jgi:hypothetical protein